MSESAQKKIFDPNQEEGQEVVRVRAIPKEEVVLEYFYNAEDEQTYEFEVTADDGNVYDTAHVYAPLDDERYLQWINDFNVTVKDGQVEQDIRESSVACWNSLVKRVENIEYEEDSEWKALMDPDEKIQSLNKYLAVVVFEGDKLKAKRKLGVSDSQTVITESYFNGEPVRQLHKLRKKNEELKKKYNRIQKKRIKPERTKGLRREPNMEFYPQERAISELYDEMFISQGGFIHDNIPMRFKTTVIHWLFGEVLDEKKSPNAQS